MWPPIGEIRSTWRIRLRPQGARDRDFGPGGHNGSCLTGGSPLGLLHWQPGRRGRLAVGSDVALSPATGLLGLCLAAWLDGGLPAVSEVGFDPFDRAQASGAGDVRQVNSVTGVGGN